MNGELWLTIPLIGGGGFVLALVAVRLLAIADYLLSEVAKLSPGALALASSLGVLFGLLVGACRQVWEAELLSSFSRGLIGTPFLTGLVAAVAATVSIYLLTTLRSECPSR